MTSRYLLLFTAIAGLLLLTAGTARAETQADTFVNTAKKNFGTNENVTQRSGRDSITNKARNYADKTLRHSKNKNPRKHRRDARLNHKKQAIANNGVND